MPTVETIDNTDSDGSAVTTQAFPLDVDITKVVSWASIVDNGFDVDVDVTVQFTTEDDESFTKYVTDDALAGVTVAAGTRDGFGDSSNNPFSYIRFEINPVADPTTGTCEVTFQRRRFGGD